MKVLAIGNSFSMDALRWLHQLAELNGVDMETVDLYVSGCSLETHWYNVENNLAEYDFELNGGPALRKITIAEALAYADWDVITVQQASPVSGIPESYEPYLTNLVNYVRKTCPKAEIWFHQTWAYEVDSKQMAFQKYDNSQQKMYECIVSTTEAMAASINAKIIPAGRLIQTLRTTVPEFDYPNGGLSLCRDTYHMSYDYGRFAVAALWLRTLTGITVKAETFEDFDPKLIQKILAVVNAY